MENITARLKTIDPTELATALVLLIAGAILSYSEFSDEGNGIYLLYLLMIAGFALGTFIWLKVVKRYFSKMVFYLVEHKWSRKVIASGSFSYYGYKDPEEKSKFYFITGPIFQVLNLLIVFVGISVFFLGFLDPDNAGKPLVWGILIVIAPIIATPLIPVLWALKDTNVKAFAEKTKTTWLVSDRYKMRYNSIITLAAIFSNLKDAEASDIGDQISRLLSAIRVGTFVMLVPVALFIIAYYGWFREELSNNLRSSLTLTTFDLELVEKDAQLEELNATEDDENQQDDVIDDSPTAEVSELEIDDEPEPIAQEEEPEPLPEDESANDTEETSADINNDQKDEEE